MKVGIRTYVLDKWLPVVTIERWHKRWHKGIFPVKTVQRVRGASLESVPLEDHLLMTSSPHFDRDKLANDLKTRLSIRGSTVDSQVVSLKVMEWKKGVILYEDNEIVNQSLAQRLKMLISDLMLEVNDVTNIRVDQKKDDLIFRVDFKKSEKT